VRKIAYFLPDCLPSYVAEKSSLKEYSVESKQFIWTDDEIAAIRDALKRLTKIRILNTNDAEDLIQETLLTMINKQPGRILEKGPLVWSMGILRKKVGNYYRKIQRYAPLSEGERSTQKLWVTLTPESRMLYKELETIVDVALSQLPDSQRRALELMIAGFNTGEIVRELHPERYQNVINRLYRGRKKLMGSLTRYGYGPGATSGLAKMKRCRGRKLRSAEGEADAIENLKA
jgi:DNA-directed RNA polymerase specialized sigma24 family protein